MKAPAAPWRAVAALAAILVIAAGWWLFALWPVAAAAPAWVLRTRQVCFGAMGDTLPSAAGWLVLIGEPIGMIGLLIAVWGAELRSGLRLVANRAAGRLALAIALFLVLGGLSAAAVRVVGAGERFEAGHSDASSQLTRVNDAAPALRLTDQAGQEVTLDEFRGRPVIVTFAFAHCATVCPLIVSEVLDARRQIESARPAILVVTLDPWRDTPGRLPSIAEAWKLDGDAHVLSGAPDDVERTLNAWRVPRTRNMKTGDVLHPAIIYIVGPDGRITYVLNGGADAIASAVRAL
jgi:protein SCO1/2